MAGQSRTTTSTAPLSGVRFVGLRFRLETRGLHRPVPVEVAALTHHGPGDHVAWRAHAPIEPPAPDGAPPAPITVPVPPAAPGSLAAALTDIERHVTRDLPHAIIGLPPFAEKTLVREQRAYCPLLASCVVLDVLTLAAIVTPTATPQSFDTRLQHLGLRPPLERAVTWDAYALAHLFHTTVAKGIATGRWSTLDDLIRVAGSSPPPVEPEFMPALDVQESLFD
ncbi:hypothetical protein [Embleya sp. NPDC020886]|uniref:hypothetical protein n=1 Tax=Embleya sp. NPDC020886 TaxID=3363980 RepID=UPI00379016B8